MTRARAGQSGQVLPMVAAVMAFLLVPLCVFVIDTGLVEAAHAQLGETVQASAEDGASMIDQDALLRSGGQRPVLDEPAARATSERSLRSSGLPGLESWTVAVHDNTVTVSATLRVHLLVVGTAHVRQTRSATFVYGG
jgi:hypothetical protein